MIGRISPFFTVSLRVGFAAALYNTTVKATTPTAEVLCKLMPDSLQTMQIIQGIYVALSYSGLGGHDKMKLKNLSLICN